MGERVILVCDVCGQPAAHSVTIKLARSNRVKDLCQRDYDSLLAGSRVPQPGRKRATVDSTTAMGLVPKRRGRPRKSETAAAPEEATVPADA